MAVHWVNYDLNTTGQKYEALITYLKSHRSWARPAKSSYFVDTDLTAKQLRDGISEIVDSNDAVAVVTVTGQSWATHGVSKEVNDWIRNHL
ncbi:hypothetical protein [Frigoribacterium sp. VKM Ac-2836]|uniref:hypothetical protein n=1 Tax=Frigoribacterium sp. VKM Ac-2836 TaxID=2739014 RepID=UPI0015658607|nr:hypothetical protein [Frigoribacterium sp. VKM Ac-2836]NRD26342.1 hypothetical protein [Frigoribacterium sp. VKM Ac-2836]